MSCFISELLIPENSGSLIWVCCQRCRRRKDCPYLYHQALHREARQEHRTAQLLASQADQILDRISSADDIRSLLSAGESLERTLSHALHSAVAGMGL